MTSPEQPDTPPLTRKQLREIRNTGATPVITGDGTPYDSAPPARDDADQGDATSSDSHEVSAPRPADDEQQTAPAAPLPRPAAPSVVGSAPITDAAVDLGVSPLTRRQARQQERIRTASVPVITPEAAAAHAANSVASPPISSVPGPGGDSVSDADGSVTPDSEGLPDTDALADPAEESAEAFPEDAADPIVATFEDEEIDDAVDAEDRVQDDEADRAVVSPSLGAAVIAGEPVEIDLPPSFDQLLAQGSTGSVGTSNALILSQGTADMPMVAPVTATGEVIITGTFNLPEGLGSTGHALGTADGKETDAVLVDGELPAHSSPTPIAASAAISTVKGAGDVIKPPAPEKGSRLMLWLAITAGALALALVGVLILAFTTGVL